MEEIKIASSEVNTCFVCNSVGKSKYLNLDDRNFGTSKGWNIVECSNNACGLMWLNPMPTVDEIGKAYESYYTHTEAKKSLTAFELKIFSKPIVSTLLLLPLKTRLIASIKLDFPDSLSPTRIFILSSKSTAMVKSVYKKLNGEEIPVSQSQNKMFARNVSYTDKRYRAMIKEMNAVIKQQRHHAPE